MRTSTPSSDPFPLAPYPPTAPEIPYLPNDPRKPLCLGLFDLACRDKRTCPRPCSRLRPNYLVCCLGLRTSSFNAVQLSNVLSRVTFARLVSPPRTDLFGFTQRPSQSAVYTCRHDELCSDVALIQTSSIKIIMRAIPLPL